MYSVCFDLKFLYFVNYVVNFLKLKSFKITTGGVGGAENARAVKTLFAAQILLARVSSNFITFPDYYSSKSWCRF